MAKKNNAKLYIPEEDLNPKLLKANPGVPKISTGTVLYQPKSSGNIKDRAESEPATSPISQKNAGEKNYVPVTEFRNNLNPVAPAAPVVANKPVSNNPASGAWGVYNQQQNAAQNNAFQTPTTGTGSGLPKPQGVQVKASDGTVNPPIPTGEYTEANAEQWRSLWKWQAEHPAETKALMTMQAIAQGKPDPFAIKVPTPQDVWNMKAEQRRRASEQADYGFTPSFSPAPQVLQPPQTSFFNFGNQSVSASWRVGG